MKNISFLFAIVAMALLSFCKKDKTDVTLEGKWNVESYIVNYFDDYVLDETETVPGNGSTFDFQPNGKVIIFQDGATLTQSYTIRPDSKVDIEGDIFEIRNLTASSVTLYFRDA